MQVIRKAHSSELAGYMADDINLIAECLICELNNEFIFSMIQSYLNGKIPSNEMEFTSKNPTNLY
jgi:hypothetical protein